LKFIYKSTLIKMIMKNGKGFFAISSLFLAFALFNGCTKSSDAPSLTTIVATELTTISATSGGNVTSDGGESVTARGVVWGTATMPTIANSKTTDGTGKGSFTSSITALTPNTMYYLRAYGTNSIGTTYGNEISFTTAQIGAATLTTDTVTAITSTTAVSGGNITADGGAAITSRGVCWNTSTNPTIANNKTIDGDGTGVFVSNLTDLVAATTYYIKSYAINSADTAYGNERTFMTP
jgi:hypothetical protein